jgi:alanyl-tRNA synthetase
MLGSAPEEGKAALVALVSKEAVDRGISAASLIDAMAPVIGGGGGGRDDMAQAGGSKPAMIEEAFATGRSSAKLDLTRGS